MVNDVEARAQRIGGAVEHAEKSIADVFHNASVEALHDGANHRLVLFEDLTQALAIAS